MRVIFVVACTVLLCAGGAAVWLFTRDRGPGPLEPDPALPELRFPEFTMTDQDGRPFTRRDLEGRVTIVGFMFSYCPLMCPSMMHQLSKIYAATADDAVRYVTISLDPVHDTPERLKQWGLEYKADGQRWRLLTGEVGLSRRILREHLKMFVDDDPKVTVPLPGGASMPNILHTGNVFLVGPDARVIGFYNTQRPEDMDALLVRAQRAARLLKQ